MKHTLHSEAENHFHLIFLLISINPHEHLRGMPLLYFLMEMENFHTRKNLGYSPPSLRTFHRATA